MEHPLTAALIITGIGMGLVFIMILLLWGFMALLVRVTADNETGEGVQPEEEAALEPVAIETGSDIKRRAAAAAVAVALLAGRQKTTRPAPPASGAPTTNLSAWQMTMRLGQSQSTKTRGRAR